MFSKPYRWCDQRCDRCPLQPSCPAAKQAYVEEAPPIARDEAGLRPAAVAHATATLTVLQVAVELGRLDGSVAASIEADAFAIAARIGRVVGLPGEEAVGHLMVLERLLHRVDAGILSLEGLLPARELARQRERRWELGRRLEPQMRAIRPEHRLALRQLVASRSAPSPFVQFDM